MEIIVSRTVIAPGELLFTIENVEETEIAEKYGFWAQFTVTYNEEDEDVHWKKADFSPLMSALDKLRTKRLLDIHFIPSNTFDVKVLGLDVPAMDKMGWFPVSKVYPPQYFKNENGSAWLTPCGKVFARANSDKSKVGMDGVRHKLKVLANDSRTDSYIEVSRIASDPIQAFNKLSKLFQFKLVSHD